MFSAENLKDLYDFICKLPIYFIKGLPKYFLKFLFLVFANLLRVLWSTKQLLQNVAGCST